MKKVLTLLTDLLGMRSSNISEEHLLNLLLSWVGKSFGTSCLVGQYISVFSGPH